MDRLRTPDTHPPKVVPLAFVYLWLSPLERLRLVNARTNQRRPIASRAFGRRLRLSICIVTTL